jgi:hypothetical protein
MSSSADQILSIGTTVPHDPDTQPGDGHAVPRNRHQRCDRRGLLQASAFSGAEAPPATGPWDTVGGSPKRDGTEVLLYMKGASLASRH